VAFGRCRKNRGGTPTGERARSGGSAQADLFVAQTAPAGADHEILRLPAFRFLYFRSFVIASASEAIQLFTVPLWIASSRSLSSGRATSRGPVGSSQ